MTHSPYGALSDELEGLIEKVGKAAGPDPALDVLLFRFEHGYTRLDFEPFDSAGPRYYAWRGDKYVGEIDARFPAYTSSIDAAIALVERQGLPWKLVLEKALEAIDNLELLPLGICRVSLSMRGHDATL